VRGLNDRGIRAHSVGKLSDSFSSRKLLALRLVVLIGADLVRSCVVVVAFGLVFAW
jgi:hypothetical protein